MTAMLPVLRLRQRSPTVGPRPGNVICMSWTNGTGSLGGPTGRRHALPPVTSVLYGVRAAFPRPDFPGQCRLTRRGHRHPVLADLFGQAAGNVDRDRRHAATIAIATVAVKGEPVPGGRPARRPPGAGQETAMRLPPQPTLSAPVIPIRPAKRPHPERRRYRYLDH